MKEVHIVKAIYCPVAKRLLRFDECGDCRSAGSHHYDAEDREVTDCYAEQTCEGKEIK